MPSGRKKAEKAQSIILRKPENIDNDTVAVSKDLGYELINGVSFVGWELLQKKLFILVLQQLNFMKASNDTTVAIDNEAAAIQLGWDRSKETFKNIGAIMRKEFDYMTKNSSISMQNPRTGKWHTGNLIYDSYGDYFTTYVKLNPNFMVHLENLIETQNLFGIPYLSMIGHDVTDFKCRFSEPLFMNLRYQWDNSYLEYKDAKFTTKDLKTIFKMDASDYMKKDPKTGELTHFNRTAFEDRALIPAIMEINSGETMRIFSWPDGKFFKKEKLNGKIHFYLIRYKVFGKFELIQNRQNVLNMYNKEFKIPKPSREWLNQE